MEKFELRRDRFDFFNRFENPLLNITSSTEFPNFIPYCKHHEIPPFHFLLFCLFEAVLKNPNFLYRLYKGSVIRISELIPSYTVMNQENNLNYTRFKYSSDRTEFIKRSLMAREEGSKSLSLINTGAELEERELKNYIFITSIPWLNFTSIQHPVYQFKSADIPSFAWGKFVVQDNTLTMPFSVQAHHGFVDGFHIHQLIETLRAEITKNIE